MKEDIAYIEHILACINKIHAFTKNMTRSDFENNVMSQDAVIRNIEIIGEATKKISKNLKAIHADIPWKEMAGMRDKLIHDYMGIDTDVIWETIIKDIPQLEVMIRNIAL